MIKKFVLVSIIVMLSGCGSDKPVAKDIPEPFNKAITFMKKMTSKRRIIKTGYIAKVRKTPLTFVSYFFSVAGSAEWPPHESSDSYEREQAKYIGDPLVPSGIKLVPFKKNLKTKVQLVVIPDDIDWQIKVEGYTDPKKPPVVVEQWSFPKF